MSLDHDFFVGLAKSWGLFILMAIFSGSVVYAYWPSNKAKFDHAANGILQSDEDEGKSDG